MHTDFAKNTIYRPVFIRKGPPAATPPETFFETDYPGAFVFDLYESQVKELIKVRHPTLRLTPEQIEEKYNASYARNDLESEGIWVYYPWSNRLLHILAEPEFAELRTARNRHKITAIEQDSLAQRRIGIIGLSVGHAVALTLATERTFGSLRLADFDTLELSNLNRIRTGLHQIGLNKCIITAREIAEIDPFLDITCFPEGITTENLENFLCGSEKLDLLIDECDDLEIKIKCRIAARSHGIPVVMETSDRGLLDVERFDLEADRPILHGILADIPEDKLTNIPPADRLPMVMRIIDVVNTSPRGRASLLEVGQTISTWPQLASAVTLGGGVVADVARRLLLGSFTDSGRFYVDLEKLVGNKDKPGTHTANAPKIPLKLIGSVPGEDYALSEPDCNFLLGEESKIAKTTIVTDSERITEIAGITAECEVIALLLPENQENDFPLPPSNPASAMALHLLRDQKVAAVIREVEGGNILKAPLQKILSASSGIACVMSDGSGEDFSRAKKVAQDIWLRAEKLGFAVQLLVSPILLFDRLKTGTGLTEKETIKLTTLRSRLSELLQAPATLQPAFLLRIHKTSTKAFDTERQPLDEILFIENSEL